MPNVGAKRYERLTQMMNEKLAHRVKIFREAIMADGYPAFTKPRDEEYQLEKLNMLTTPEGAEAMRQELRTVYTFDPNREELVEQEMEKAWLERLKIMHKLYPVPPEFSDELLKKITLELE